MDTLVDFLEFMTPYGMYSYFLMYGVLLACGFGFPMPEDIVLITGGILSSREITNIWWVNGVCMAGVLMGDGVIFIMGRRFGPAIKSRRLFRRILNEKNDKRVMSIFSKYGDKVIFMARFMPGLRMPIFLTAGIYQVKPWKFFALDGFAALISVPVWIYVGYIFGANLEDLEERLTQFQFGMYGVALAVLILLILIGIFKKKVLRQVTNGA